jgi:hypothetical protein
MLKELQEMAGRNSFAHGFVDDSSVTDMYSLITRQVKHEYTAKSKDLNLTTFAKHIGQFMKKLFGEAFPAFNITMEDIRRHKKSISTDAADHALRAASRRESKASSSAAKGDQA